MLRLDYECSGFTAVQIAHVDLATAVVDWGQSYADASALRRVQVNCWVHDETTRQDHEDDTSNRWEADNGLATP